MVAPYSLQLGGYIRYCRPVGPAAGYCRPVGSHVLPSWVWLLVRGEMRGKMSPQEGASHQGAVAFQLEGARHHGGTGNAGSKVARGVAGAGCMKSARCRLMYCLVSMHLSTTIA